MTAEEQIKEVMELVGRLRHCEQFAYSATRTRSTSDARRFSQMADATEEEIAAKLHQLIKDEA